MATVRFRDGERELPEHLVARFAGTDTRRLTYDEAMAESNQRELRDYLNGIQRRVVREHFERSR